MPVERKILLGDALSGAREAIRDSEAGSAHPASPSRFRTCIANARTKNFVRAAAVPLTAASARKGSPSELPTYFSDALAD